MPLLKQRTPRLREIKKVARDYIALSVSFYHTGPDTSRSLMLSSTLGCFLKGQKLEVMSVLSIGTPQRGHREGRGKRERPIWQEDNACLRTQGQMGSTHPWSLPHGGNARRAAPGYRRQHVSMPGHRVFSGQGQARSPGGGRGNPCSHTHTFLSCLPTSLSTEQRPIQTS